ncbi:MAG: B12-binding domain-containing radical SAM protein [Candidatus Eisenbacteria bacterium]|nr:B12-binding domain-containing radical SAM protein [Candidatus Eisenbacteria bacterium]
MNVLLVYPRFPDTFWSFKHALKFIHKRASVPPLGLLTVAAMLPAGWGRRLVDLNVGELRAADLEWADLVFVGAMIAQRDSAREVIARCRAAGRTVVAGGPLFAVKQEHFPGVDHFVLGEAELSLEPFLRDFQAGAARRVYHADGLADVRLSPAPQWELADLRRYASMSVQWSRGCPFDCDFCNVTAMFGHVPRLKSSAQVIGELDALYRLGWRGEVFFVDDNLVGNKRRLREDLLPALIAWREGKRGLSFYTQASINLADDDALMSRMAQAGFTTVFIGIETPDEAGLAECHKRQNTGRDLVADVKRIQRAGLQVQGGFILGFDNDLPTIFQRQVDFIQMSGIVTAMVGLLQAIPGTRLWERLHGEDRLLGESTGDNVDGTLNFVPRMDAAALREGYHRVLERLYSPREYYRRVRTFLREYHPPKMDLRLDWQNSRAFVWSNLRLGVVGRERWHYWGLLLWTLFRRPTLMRVAVTLAIYGHHFRKTCEGIRA